MRQLSSILTVCYNCRPYPHSGKMPQLAKVPEESFEKIKISNVGAIQLDQLDNLGQFNMLTLNSSSIPNPSTQCPQYPIPRFPAQPANSVSHNHLQENNNNRLLSNSLLTHAQQMPPTQFHRPMASLLRESMQRVNTSPRINATDSVNDPS